MQDLVRKYAVGGLVPGEAMQMAQHIGTPGAIGGGGPFAAPPQVGGMPPMGSSPQLAQGQQMAMQQAMQPPQGQPMPFNPAQPGQATQMPGQQGQQGQPTPLPHPTQPPPVSPLEAMNSVGAAEKVMQSLTFDPLATMNDASERRRAVTEEQKDLLATLREKYADPSKPDRADMWARISQAFSGPSDTKGISGRLSKTAVSLADWKQKQAAAEEARLMKLMGIDTKIGEAEMGRATRDEDVALKLAELEARPKTKQQFAGPAGEYKVGDKTVSAVPIFDNQQNYTAYMTALQSGEATSNDAYKYGATDLKKLGEHTPKGDGDQWSDPYMTTVGGREVLVRKNLATNKTEQVSAGPTSMGGDMDITIQDVENIAQAVAAGGAVPAQIPKRGTAYLKIMSRAMEINPQLDMRTADADYSVARNPMFRQRFLVSKALPTVLDHMVEVGKELGYSDVRTVGRMQQFLKGEFNDPKYHEYMTMRNDALMEIANVMRSSGATDAATRLEEEATAPTMSPAALDGWLRGQLKSLSARIEMFEPVITPLPQLRVGSKYQGKTVVDVGTSPDGRRHAMFNDGSTAEIK